MLALKSLSFSYQNNIIFEDLNQRFKKGEVTAIVGRSGVGKSTFFSLLAGQEKLKAGSITLDERNLTDLPSNKRPVIPMFQQESLFPHMSVYENIRFPLVSKYNHNRFKGIDHKAYILERLKEVKLEDLADRMPDTLSGGQKQRATLARSLAAKPEVLLLDEPFSALNDELKYSLNHELNKLVKNNNIIALKITHDLYEALNFADSILYLDKGVNFKFNTADIDHLIAPAEVIEYFMLGVLTIDKSAYFPLHSLNEIKGEHSFNCEIITKMKRGGLYEYSLKTSDQNFKYFSEVDYKKSLTLYANNEQKIMTLKGN